MQKRAIAIADLSCVGRCSLTVSLPILSAAGINTAVIPTAVLSTQTDGFLGYTLRDLTDDISPISEHLGSLSLPFSAIYVGYLASAKQAQIVLDTINKLKSEDTFILIDPVLADNGELYSGLTSENIEQIKVLCKEADLITPNCTEAAFLLGEEYKGNLFTETELREKLVALSNLGAKNIVLTGICTIDGKIGAASYSKSNDEMSIYEEDLTEGFFPGCGDTFASALLCAIMNGYSLFDASKFAVSFVKKCIDFTVKNGDEPRYGLCFEYALSDICKLTERKIESKLKNGFDYKDEVRKLFTEYLDMVVENEPKFKDYLALQNIDDEIANLEHKYAMPEGRLYILFCDNEPAGCVALKKLDNFGKCEIKRLYVKQKFRQHGFGTLLIKKIIEDAKNTGYKEMYLDTFAFLSKAISIYKSLGFYEVESYNGSPMDNLIYLKLDL